MPRYGSRDHQHRGPGPDLIREEFVNAGNGLRISRKRPEGRRDRTMSGSAFSEVRWPDRGMATEPKGRTMNPADLAPTDLSIFTLFLQAHWIVKTVMVGLLACSIWVWAIAVDKFILYRRSNTAMDRFEQAFWSGQSLEELYRTISSRPNTTMAALFVAAMREWKRSFEGQPRSFAGLQMRIEKVMDVTITREVERLERHLLVLATVGSAGPFIGLFGTVWGIMTSFQSIAASKNTSLAVVAPGIAEALFATAIGLVAAIPATIFYNQFSSDVNRQAQRLEGFADEFAAILSRQIDERV
jgi:biopolymer transport protein TolQ